VSTKCRRAYVLTLQSYTVSKRTNFGLDCDKQGTPSPPVCLDEIGQFMDKGAAQKGLLDNNNLLGDDCIR